MRCISYRSGYKYQLKESCEITIELRPPEPICTEYVSLDSDGILKLKNGYAWDGPSGPAIDTINFMRGSLVHDALYQLMRDQHLDCAIYRETADRILRNICVEDGMSRIRAWWVYKAVRCFANVAADPANSRPLIRVPKGCQP